MPNPLFLALTENGSSSSSNNNNNINTGSKKGSGLNITAPLNATSKDDSAWIREKPAPSSRSPIDIFGNVRFPP